VNLKKKLEWYWRVNLLGPGPRLMRKEFTGLRSHKGWETLLYITLVKVTRRCPWLHHSVLWCLCAIWWWHSRTYVLHHFQIDFFLKKNHTCVHILPLLNKTVMGDNLSPSLCLSLSLTHTHTYTHTHTHAPSSSSSYLSWSWATCWPIPVSCIQKSLQRSTMIPSASWGVL